ncbi:MAG: hypothetical protein R3A47_10515 [Polyangiales bacterium]
MQRVFHNLARNAAEAIGDRGGECLLEVDRADDGALVITFTDDGPGVSDEIAGSSLSRSPRTVNKAAPGWGWPSFEASSKTTAAPSRLTPSRAALRSF